MKEDKTDETKKLLKVTDLSRKFGISPRTIYNQLSHGTFPIKPIRIGKRLLRWRRRDVEKYLESL